MDAIYTRQSVDREDSISVSSQVEFCSYETRGGEYQIYSDKGYSGKNTERPDFKRMLADIESGLLRKVIVYKLDRISRSILDFANMMELFQRYGVEFVSSTEKFDTSTPMGRAMFNICIVFAQLERETVQKRVADAYYSRSKRGFYMGGRLPYGFSIQKAVIDGVKTSKYVPVPEEQDQLKMIYSLYEKPESSLGDVLRFLETNNIPHLRGKHWETSRISEMMRNPVYVKADIDVYNFFKNYGTEIINDAADFIGTNGCYLYKGESGKNNKTYDLSDRHLVLAPHEGFISSDIWLRCRLKCMDNHQSAHTHKGKNSWLIGKVKCGKCGYALTIKKAKTKAGRYFNCISRYSSRRCSGPGTIYASEFESLILEEIKQKLSEFKEVGAKKSKAANPKINEFRVKLTEVEKEIKSLMEQLPQAGNTLVAYINERIEVLDTDRKQLQKSIAELSIKTENADMKKISADINMWDKLSFDDKKTIIDALIKIIIVDEDSIKITWLI